MGEEIVRDLLVMILFAALGFLFLAGLVLQFIAMQHKKRDWVHFAFKDSLFRNRKRAYTADGMKYINAQKIVALLIVGLAVLLALLTTQGGG